MKLDGCGQSTDHVEASQAMVKCMLHPLSALESHGESLSKEGTQMMFWVMDILQGQQC